MPMGAGRLRDVVNEAPLKLDYAPPTRRAVWSPEPSAPALLAVAAIAVALAIQIWDGEYTFVSLLLVTLALIATGLAVASRHLPAARPSGLLPVLVCGLVLQFLALF